MCKRKKLGLLLILALAFLGCLLAVLYPVLSNHYAERHQSQVRTAYNAAIEEAHEEWDAIRQEAERYNARLASGVMSSAELLALPEYDALLDPSGTGIMGYVVIPKLDVELPVYHGDSNAALDDGAAHLQGTSLPVGGENTHAVISGHTGMAGQRMFTDLDALEIGDVFYLDVLGSRLAYQVDQILTVLPYEVEPIRIVEGRDLATLLTCTPYGVNSHRLLVRGSRIDYEEAEAIEEAAPAEQVQSTWMAEYQKGILIGLAILAVLLIPAILWRLVRRYMRRKRHEA